MGRNDKKYNGTQSWGTVPLDLDLFHPTRLQQEGGLEAAKESLVSSLYAPSDDKDSLFDSLLSQPALFEFSYSVINSEAAGFMKECIVLHFPQPPTEFPESLAHRLLSHLSRFCDQWNIQVPTINTNELYQAVELAPAALKAALELLDSMATLPESPTDSLRSGKARKERDRQRYQRQQTLQKRAVRRLDVDCTPITRFGLNVPQSEESAREVVDVIMRGQLETLTKYLDLLRDPSLKESIKNAYIPSTQDRAPPVTALQPMNNRPASASAVSKLAQSTYVYESPADFGPWRLLVSGRANRQLREKRRSRELWNAIMKTMRYLSHGHFSGEFQSAVIDEHSDIPIFMAKVTSTMYLIYHVDCIKEIENDYECQGKRFSITLLLSIFGIYNNDQLDKSFWASVSRELQYRGAEYCRRCAVRNGPDIDGVFVPASFPPRLHVATATNNVGSHTSSVDSRADEYQEVHALLVLEKFVTFSQALLNSILADEEVSHLFHLHPKEQEIVKHEGSCYVQGRSGTGKTTTMLFKIVALERTWDIMRSPEDPITRPRQLFITQSDVLAKKVEEYFVKLWASSTAANRTAKESVLLARKTQNARSRGLIPRNEMSRDDIPTSFKQLTDDHFPLFLSTNELYNLLEHDLGLARGNEYLALLGFVEGSHRTGKRGVRATARRLPRDPYKTFLAAYCPHLPQNLTKNLDPALVFAEFMGVIRGSERTLSLGGKDLDRSSYMSLGERTHSTFSDIRERIYALYQAYMRIKSQRGDLDPADRTHAIIRELKEKGVPGDIKVDFLYVDEVQDNLLIDTSILRMLCRNPNGLFWAGDTAQTISAGSVFRFNDLKAYMHEYEKSGQYAKITCPEPVTFELTVNYRSHAGIVNPAQTVLRLIKKFWPNSIDNVLSERGTIGGPKPAFLSGWTRDNVQFLFGDQANRIDFGSQQCILVRDDNARMRLQSQVGERGIIMTLYESKGLEFDDILLYNFFEDSTVSETQWRVLLNEMPEGKRPHCPTFDATRHNGVCRELKALYVALTRARKNVWIADCSEKGEAMKTIWVAQDYVVVYGPNDEPPRIHTTSSSEEWADTARALFDKGRFGQAMHCYERAHMQREQDIAYAYYLLDQAYSCDRPQAYLRAARALLRSAGEAVTEDELKQYRLHAAECLVHAGKYHEAGDNYYRVGEYTLAAQSYRRAESFDHAVRVIQSHGEKVDNAVSESIIAICKLHYLKGDDLRWEEGNNLKKVVALFKTQKDALQYMKDLDFNVARAKLLEANQCPQEAADAHVMNGDVKSAITTLLQDVDDDSSLIKASDLLLDALWERLPIGVVWTEGIAADASDYFEFVERILPMPNIPERTKLVFRMFIGIKSDDRPSLLRTGEALHDVHKDSISATRCFDHVFNHPNVPHSFDLSSRVALIEQLLMFLRYARGMHWMATRHDVCLDPAIQRLIGFKRTQECLVTVRPASVLYRETLSCDSGEDTPDGARIPEVDFHSILRRALWRSLRFSITAQYDQCREARVVTPCPSFVASGKCGWNERCNRTHVTSESLTAAWYNDRVRIQCLQIIICLVLGLGEQSRHLRRSCLESLYQCLYPPHPALGSIANLDINSIPEWTDALRAINDSVQDRLYNIHPYKSLVFLSALVPTLKLAFTFNAHQARRYLHRVPFVNCAYPPKEYMRGDRYIALHLLSTFNGMSEACITMGLWFVQHVCSYKLTLDVNILCDLIEYLCGSFVIAYKLKMNRSLHGALLPSSWLLSLPSHSQIGHRHSVNIFASSLVACLQQLLENILSDDMPAYLSSGNTGSFHKSYPLRSMFASRILRAICLLAFNVNDEQLRAQTLDTITSLVRSNPERLYYRLCSRYLAARNWNALVDALRRSSQESKSQFDELVFLQHQQQPTAANIPTGIRVVSFRDRNHLVLSLKHGQPDPSYGRIRGGGGSLPDTLHGGLRGGGGTSLPFARVRALFTRVQPAHNLASTLPINHDDSPEVSTPSVSILREKYPATEENVSSAMIIQAAFRNYCIRKAEHEVRAATIIQRAYRHHLYRSERTTDAFGRWYATCLKESQHIRRPVYRLHFLAFMPYVMIALEKIMAYAFKDKEAAKQRLRMDDQVLEEVNAHLTQASDLCKEVIELKNVLYPSAPLHTQVQDMHQLQTVIQELAHLLETLPPPIQHNVREESKSAILHILEWVPMRRAPRPQLVIDNGLPEWPEFDYPGCGREIDGGW
ncbi:hypothetical protein K474DRAFT_1770489 [Panus rudis PR-1116 ss-1]|nr:hypothetical protein K474DRAFT_1770489 [Panus rudis PR-1116 ss-1]